MFMIIIIIISSYVVVCNLCYFSADSVTLRLSVRCKNAYSYPDCVSFLHPCIIIVVLENKYLRLGILE